MPRRRPSLKHAAPLGADIGERDFDRHAALLEESRMSSTVKPIQEAITVRQLQRDHGTGYVQRLIEHVSHRRATYIRAKITGGSSWDKGADRIAQSRSK